MDSFVSSLLLAAGQTFVGALGSYFISSIHRKLYKEISFDGPLDLWMRGINSQSIGIGEKIYLDGLLSPFVQLFPRDPFENAKRWNTLYSFEGKISAQEYSKLEFYAGSDDTIRTGSLNGETLVGLYGRYGYIGEGILGVVPTNYLLKVIPSFFVEEFFGIHVIIEGILSKCPTQHSFIARKMYSSAGISLETDNYKEIPYIQIHKIHLFNKTKDQMCSLLGSPWAATSLNDNPFIVQYGYLHDKGERTMCNNNIFKSKAWNNVEIFYDTINSPSRDISFSVNFIK